MRKSAWPNSTGCPFSTRISATLPAHLGLDLVHQLHRLDDAEHLALLHHRAHLHEGGLIRGGRPVERAHERARHHVAGLLRAAWPAPAAGAGAAAPARGRVLHRRHRHRAHRRRHRSRVVNDGAARAVAAADEQPLIALLPDQPRHIRGLEHLHDLPERVHVQGRPGARHCHRPSRTSAARRCLALRRHCVPSGQACSTSPRWPRG